jgi:hypothetical protein
MIADTRKAFDKSQQSGSAANNSKLGYQFAKLPAQKA